MDIYKAVIATVTVAAAFPVVVVVMSFVMWQNGFKVMGWPYVARMSVALVALFWLVALIPVGGK